MRLTLILSAKPEKSLPISKSASARASRKAYRPERVVKSASLIIFRSSILLSALFASAIKEE